MRELLRNFVSGWLAAQLFLLALLLFDTGGIGRLIGAASLATAWGTARTGGQLVPAPAPARLR